MQCLMSYTVMRYTMYTTVPTVNRLSVNLNILMQDNSMYLGKANLIQKICKRGPQSSEIFGQKFKEIIIWANSH